MAFSETSSKDYECLPEDVCRKFKLLSKGQRMETLQNIFGLCTPEEMFTISSFITNGYMMDFTKFLPIEITEKIFSYLDACDLLNCLQVSRQWYEIVSSYDGIWEEHCNRIGFSRENELKLSCSWKDSFVGLCINYLNLCDGEALNMVPLVYATTLHWVSESGELFITQKEEDVTVWQFPALCVQRFKVSTNIACLAYEDGTIVASIFPGRILIADKSSNKMEKFCCIPHTECRVILLSLKADLVICGCVDRTIKYWSIRSKRLMHIENGHNSWIKVLKILPGSDEKCVKLLSLAGQTLVIRNIFVEQDGISAVRVSVKLLCSLTCESDFSISRCPPCFDSEGQMYVLRRHQDSPVYTVDKFGFTEGKISVQEYRFDPKRHYCYNFALVGVGSKYIVFSYGLVMTSFGIFKFPSFEIVTEIKSNSPKIPMSCATDSVMSGDRSWLDGLTSDLSSRKCWAFMILHTNRKLHATTWNSDELELKILDSFNGCNASAEIY